MAKLNLKKQAALAKAGDEDALRHIYTESRGMLRGMANVYYMVGADRDDIIQEGMIGLLYAIRTFNPDGGASFRTFAELCVKRRIINAVKLAGRKKHMPLNESVSIESETSDTYEALLAPSATNPEEMVLLADLLGFIGRNAPTLFSEMELGVWDAYSCGNNAAEIAEMLGKSPKSVDNALTRIKGKIEKLVSLY